MKTFALAIMASAVSAASVDLATDASMPRRDEVPCDKTHHVIACKEGIVFAYRNMCDGQGGCGYYYS